MSVDELVEVFREQINLYGVAKFLPLLTNSTGTGIVGAHNNRSGSDRVQSDSSDEGSLDIVSDSDHGDDNSDGNSGYSSDDDIDALSDDVVSNDGSVNNDAIGVHADNNMIYLHDPPLFDSLHCPPFNSIDITTHGVCNCGDFGMEVCGIEDEFQFFVSLDFLNEYNEAFASVDSIDRIPSNLLRKRLYKLLFHATDFGILEKKERRKLPNCAVAKIRQIYPSPTGYYMGFKEN